MHRRRIAALIITAALTAACTATGATRAAAPAPTPTVSAGPTDSTALAHLRARQVRAAAFTAHRSYVRHRAHLREIRAARAAREAAAASVAAAPRNPTFPPPWDRLAACESGDGSGLVTSSSKFRGYFQFLPSTWASLGGSGDPAAAPASEQLARAVALQARDGWGQWPRCSLLLGLRHA